MDADSSQERRTDNEQSSIAVSRARGKDRTEPSKSSDAYSVNPDDPPTPRDNTHSSSKPVESSNVTEKAQEPSNSSFENERHRRIAEAAYYRSQRRGFSPGQEDDDWLEAEKEVDRGQGL